MNTRLRVALTALVFAVVLPLAAPVGAQQTTQTPNYNACAISTSAAVICKTAVATQPHYLIGYYNGSNSAQAVSVLCTDGVNPINIGPLGISQGFQFPAPGFPIVGTYTCTPSSAPTGTIYILVQ